MEELTYIWEAFYDDGTSLKQFDGEEHHFGHIDQSKLQSFDIYHKDSPHDRYCVDLNYGLIYYKDNVIYGRIVKNENVKLIYFRRVQRTLNGNQPTKITNFLGFSDKNGKHVIAVSENRKYEIIN